MSAVPISGTKELASRTPGIVWHTRSDTFVLIPLLELTRAVAQHHAGFIFKITLVREIYYPHVLWSFFDCLFIDSFCDLCPTRHHKRGATRDYSQQNSSIALLLSPCFRGTRRNAGGGTVGANRRVCPMSRFCHLDGAPATRDLSHSVEMTWSAPRRSSLIVNRSSCCRMYLTTLAYRIPQGTTGTVLPATNCCSCCRFASKFVN